MAIQSFGQFLLSQKSASGSLGELAQIAARDPKFPRNGTPEQISHLLNQQEADIAYHEPT
jgi:uncharacterized protein YozE (UPF0346 family)